MVNINALDVGFCLKFTMTFRLSSASRTLNNNSHLYSNLCRSPLKLKQKANKPFICRWSVIGQAIDCRRRLKQIHFTLWWRHLAIRLRRRKVTTTAEIVVAIRLPHQLVPISDNKETCSAIKLAIF